MTVPSDVLQYSIVSEMESIHCLPAWNGTLFQMWSLGGGAAPISPQPCRCVETVKLVLAWRTFTWTLISQLSLTFRWPRAKAAYYILNQLKELAITQLTAI